jgi:hypothetical protein
MMRRELFALASAAIAVVGFAGCAQGNAAQTVDPGGGGATTTVRAAVTTTVPSSAPATTTTVRSPASVTTNPDGTPKAGMWTSKASSGPFADSFMSGGKVQCTASAQGAVWKLQPLDGPGAYGTVQLTMTDPAALDAVPVVITAADGKETLAEGSAKVTITPAAAGPAAFTFRLTYKAISTASGQTGAMQAEGVCPAESAPGA